MFVLNFLLIWIMANAEQESSKQVTGTNDQSNNQSFDAKRLNEEIQEGDQQAPNVDVDSDYEKSKRYSQPGGQDDSQAAGNPDDFRTMARDVGRSSR